ncbi:hypothetical protein FBU59_004199, partial [Linderina macrospora]
MVRILATALAVAPLAAAQFAFDPSTYDASVLAGIISARYGQYQQLWEGYLETASTKFPDAYTKLTAYFGTNSIPETYDAAWVSQFAKQMHDAGATTIVDNQVNSATFIFTRTS